MPLPNWLFITFDSLRWDVFDGADVPFLRSLGSWHKALTHGTFTLPAHMAFFSGKLPVVVGAGEYLDTVWRVTSKRELVRARSLWRMMIPESPNDTLVQLAGRNVIEGFNILGYVTIGTGSVEWFNDCHTTSLPLVQDFAHYAFRGGSGQSTLAAAEMQLEWVKRTIEAVDLEQPLFLFMNFGETHHPFPSPPDEYSRASESPFGDHALCFERQTRALVYLDKLLSNFCFMSRFTCMVMCGDHGTCFGEDGLWGHNVAHPKVLEVPLLVKAALPLT